MAEPTVETTEETTDELNEIFNSAEETSEETSDETDDSDQADEDGDTEKEEEEKEEEKEEDKEDKESEETSEDAEEETGEEEKETEEEGTTEEEIEQEKISKLITEENQELRSAIRAMKQELALLKAKSVETEEDDEGNRIPTEIEKLSDNLKQTLAEKKSILNLQPMVMRNTKEFSDVDEVCAAKNWDGIVDAAAQGIVDSEGIDEVTAKLKVENFIWGQENPYEFMYNTIKEHHPDYQEKDETKKTGGGSKKKVAKKSKKAPGSVAKMSSSTAKGSGWTSEKIDKLPEEELAKVPADVYRKYMQDELD